MKADFISSCRLSRRNHARPRTASQRSTCRYMICKWLSGKESACSAGDPGAVGSTSGSGRFPWRRAQQPTPVSLPGESHGQRSLVGYSPRGRTESDTTEVTDTHTQSVDTPLRDTQTVPARRAVTLLPRRVPASFIPAHVRQAHVSCCSTVSNSHLSDKANVFGCFKAEDPCLHKIRTFLE